MRRYFMFGATALLGRPGPLSRRYISHGGTATPENVSMRDVMQSTGFKFNTPNFTLDRAEMVNATSATDDLVTTTVTSLDFVRDMYGPWLVLTEDIQGELFMDHDKMVYLRPANGLGFGVGRITMTQSGASGTAFLLFLEYYLYPATATAPPNNSSSIEVSGFVKRVQSSVGDYTTFTLSATWRKSDGSSGNFNAAKLSPWEPKLSEKPWEPNKDVMHAFREVFPKPLKLDSHVKRAEAARNSNIGGKGETGIGESRIDDSVCPSPHHLQLDKYRVGELADMFYIPNYISEQEEAQIMELVRTTPKELKSQLAKRTVQEWGCSMCPTCNGSFVPDRNMPPWVEACTDMQVYDGLFTPSTFPNSVRIHEYTANECIGPHCDGPIYIPRVTVLSIGSPCVMFFYPRREPHAEPMEHYNDTFRFKEGIAADTPVQCVVLERRSILVFSGDVYHHYPHGTCDREVVPLTPDKVGTVVNRHLLQDPGMTEVHKGYRVSLTTRNLLPRCNHEPSRVEYGMKRAWYMYNQLPVPNQLFEPVPQSALTKQTDVGSISTPKAHTGAKIPAGGTPLETIENRLDQLFAQQKTLAAQLNDLSQAVAAGITFRNEVSTVLGHLTTTVLEMDNKLDDVLDKLSSNEWKGKQ
ncbi:hypothetical protein TRVL_06615 [Trypanosoma vivax]|nr:hypothetical protein TRVL_06615 [Trypanosoma vivax]